jgi:hypothetical protein
MAFPASRIGCALLLGIMAALSSRADSFASSASSGASSASSASVGSLSDSLRSSSGGSGDSVAEGDYRIVEVAAGSPDTLRLQLRRLGEGAAVIRLDLPRLALGDREARPGGVVGVRRRPYGYEFAWADTRVPFFLVLAADWHRELDPRPVL